MPLRHGDEVRREGVIDMTKKALEIAAEEGEGNVGRMRKGWRFGSYSIVTVVSRVHLVIIGQEEVGSPEVMKWSVFP